MAVFPGIAVKSFLGDQATLEAEIGPGGDEEIVKGELVLWRGPQFNRIYTKDAQNNLVIIGKRSAPAYTTNTQSSKNLYARRVGIDSRQILDFQFTEPNGSTITFEPISNKTYSIGTGSFISTAVFGPNGTNVLQLDGGGGGGIALQQRPDQAYLPYFLQDDSWSMTFWYYQRGTASDPVRTNNEASFYSVASNSLRFYVSGVAGSDTSTIQIRPGTGITNLFVSNNWGSGGPLLRNQWHYVELNYDSTRTGAYYKLFIDGSLVGSLNDSAKPTAPGLAVSIYPTIGRIPGFSLGNNGYIGNFALWSNTILNDINYTPPPF